MLRLAVVSFAVALFVAGCGGPFHTSPGSSVFVEGLTGVTFVSHGGGMPVQPPDGAACTTKQWSFDYAPDTRVLQWNWCHVTGDYAQSSSWVPREGRRELRADEAAAVESALRAVKVSDSKKCGADLDLMTLELRSGAASLTYANDFYACRKDRPAFVESYDLLLLLTALESVAR